MKRRLNILAGTALGALLSAGAAGAASALPLPSTSGYGEGLIILAQGQDNTGAGAAVDCEATPNAAECAREKPARKAKPEAQAPKAKPESQAPKAEQEPAQRQQPKAEVAPEPRKQEKAKPGEAAPEPRQKQAQPKAEPKPKIEAAPARKEKPENKQAAEPPKPAPKVAEPRQAEPRQAEPEKSAEPAKPTPKRLEKLPRQADPENKQAAEPAKPEPKAGEPANDNEVEKVDKADKPADRKEKLRNFLKNKQDGSDAQEAGKPAAESGTSAGNGKAEQPAPKPGAGEQQQAKPDQKAAPGNDGQQAAQPKGGEKAGKPILPGNLKLGKQRRQERVTDQAETNQLPKNAAPVLDSAKKGAAAGSTNAGQQGQAPDGGNLQDGNGQKSHPIAKSDTPPPESDSAAQKASISPADIVSLLTGEGRRFEPDSREERRKFRRERRERREDARVVKEYDDNRTIIRINNQIFIDSPDSDRVILRDDRVYYDELPGGRTREVIMRPDGTRVVTVRNRYGDIIRRSRILPDGGEVVLVYVPDDQLERVAEWGDPGANLPPLQLTVPISSYILEAAAVEDPDRYYTFLEQPPIAEIERIYSVEEVRRSARLRDTMPRIDLDTLNFETGSAEISESEVDELDAIAQAILQVLQENPGETFLIEGHTDAVGSEESNLVLSDRRAESVAAALTSVYDIPPENLVTQGYGEQYLKVATEDSNRQNRRVSMRRITPLVAPVASAE